MKRPETGHVLITLHDERTRNHVSIPKAGRDYSTASRPVLGSIQPRSAGERGGGSIPEGKTSLANHSTSLYSPLLLWGSRDSVTGTATGLGAEQAGVQISSPKCGTYPASNSMRRETNHSPPSCAEMKNECSYTSIPPYASLAQTDTSYSNRVTTLFRVVQILSHTFWPSAASPGVLQHISNRQFTVTSRAMFMYRNAGASAV
jgi:hypothetical protein